MPNTTSKPFINVAAGLILRPDGALLLGQRPVGKPWEGWWELPGGKLEPGETPLQALARELHEELDIQVTQATPWVTYVHEYPKTIVRLAFCRVTGWKGEPRGAENQALAWVDPNAPLTVGPVLPATEPPLRWLKLPARYHLTSVCQSGGLANYLPKLHNTLQHGTPLVQFREPGWGTPDTEQAFHAIVRHCHNAGAQCLVNSSHPQAWWQLADGVQLRASDAQRWVNEKRQRTDRSDGKLLGVSVHNDIDLANAKLLDADFVVLGHVLPTPSHPTAPALGWKAFQELTHKAGMPVYAIGGQSAATLHHAQQHGAHGIAGIRKL